MHDILSKIEDLDATIGASTDVSHNCKQAARRTLATLAQDVAADIGAPAPGSTMGLASATITHRPDVAYAETALRKADAAGHGGFAGHRSASIQEEQAAMQGDADGLLPDRVPTPGNVKALTGSRPTHVIEGNAGTIQAPTPLHPAEPAKIGTDTR